MTNPKRPFRHTRRSVHTGNAYERGDRAGRRPTITTRTTRNSTGELTELLNDYAGRPSRLYYAEKMTKDLGGAKIYLKARGSEPHRRAQNQQRPRTGASGEEDGQDPRHRRDRRRTARRRDRDRGGSARNGVRRLHGKGGHRASGAQRLPYAPARRGGHSGHDRNRDSQGRGIRGHAASGSNRIDDTHYCLGSVMGPHPFPTIVRDFQAVISKEIKSADA